jgi:hypothetical protein
MSDCSNTKLASAYLSYVAVAMLTGITALSSDYLQKSFPSPMPNMP